MRARRYLRHSARASKSRLQDAPLKAPRTGCAQGLENRVGDELELIAQSLLHRWLGVWGLNRRRTKPAATGKRCRLSVVTTNLRFALTRIPCWCISLRTRSLPTLMPLTNNSLCMHGQPYPSTPHSRPFHGLEWVRLLSDLSAQIVLRSRSFDVGVSLRRIRWAYGMLVKMPVLNRAACSSVGTDSMRCPDQWPCVEQPSVHGCPTCLQNARSALAEQRASRCRK